MGYNVAYNPIGALPNGPIASAPVKELHLLVLSIIVIHGGQVNRERRYKKAIAHNILYHFPSCSF